MADQPGKANPKYLLNKTIINKINDIKANNTPINNEKYSGTSEKEVIPLINSL